MKRVLPPLNYILWCIWVLICIIMLIIVCFIEITAQSLVLLIVGGVVCFVGSAYVLSRLATQNIQHRR